MARTLRRRLSATSSAQNYSVNVSAGEFNPSSAGSLHTDYELYDNTQYAAIDTAFPNSVIKISTSISRLCPTIGTADSTKCGEVATVIGYANDNGLKVVIDLHDYGGKYIEGVDRKIGSAQYTQANFVSDITALTNYFKDVAGFLGFGISNEPNSMPVSTDSDNYNTTATWTLAANAACAAIKAISSSIVTCVCTDNFSGFQALTTTYPKNPFTNADYIEIHAYFDSNNSGSYAGANATFAGSGRDIRYGGDTLATCATWARANNCKLIIGEIGVPPNDEGYLTMLSDFYRVASISHDVIKGVFYWATKTGWYISITANDITNTNQQMAIVGKYQGSRRL